VSASSFDWVEFSSEVARRTEGVVRSPAAEAARLNALVAVELDPVRLRERVGELRLAAAVALAPQLVIAECLLAGAAVPAGRLDPEWVLALDLAGDVVLDYELALRVNAHGPLEEVEHGR
jgi:hypothetical protein